MGQTTNLQVTASEFLQEAEYRLIDGDFALAESAVSACLKLMPDDKRALAMLDKIKRRDAVDVRSEHDLSVENVPLEFLGPFTTGSGARHGRFLPHQVPDDGKEEAISLARRYEASKSWSAAASAWEAVLKADPSDTWAWTQYAHLLSVNLHDHKKAEDAYCSALDIDPTDDWAWGKLGIMIADFGGKVSEGQEMLRRAIELDPSEAYYKAWLGWSLFYQSEDSEEAAIYLQEAVKLLPSYQWAWFHLAYLLSTLIGRHKEARTAFQKSIKLSPSNVASHFNLAILYQDAFSQPKQALKYFKKVTVLNPDDAASWRRIAFLQRDQFGDTGEAISAFTKTVSLDPKDHESWTILGHLLWEEAKEMTASLSALNEALRLMPESPWIWCHLGDYYCYGVIDIGSAEVAYRKALEINDTFDWALSHLGSLLLDHKNEAEEAERYLQKAIDTSPNYIFALRELINCKKILNRDHSELACLYEKILDVEPDSIDVVIEYAELLGESLNEPEKGLEILKAAYVEAPDHFYLQWTLLHYCIYTLGRAFEAAPVVESLEKMGSDEMPVACLLAYYYSDAEGDFERAGLWYKRSIELAPDDHFAMHEYGVFLLYHQRDTVKALDVLTQSALLDSTFCSGLEGDISLAKILTKHEKRDDKKGTIWVDEVLKEESPNIEMLYAAALLSIVYKNHDTALGISTKMISLYPSASKAWLCHLACLILTAADEGLICKAREKAVGYKASWVNFEEALANITNPLGLDI